jgi:hypothetical protein
LIPEPEMKNNLVDFIMNGNVDYIDESKVVNLK